MHVRVLLLHGYSDANKGDGLLVEESVRLLRDTLGQEAAIDLVASYPESFSNLENVNLYGSKPSLVGYSRDYVRLMTKGLRSYDLVVGVGGGYLRFGTLKESVKSILVMLPQLVAAATTSIPTVYLPQSIGPLRFGTRGIVRTLLRRMGTVWVRDDRSVEELDLRNVRRGSDLALLSLARKRLPWEESNRLVLSVRSHRGGVPESVVTLSQLLGEFDGYVQSAVSANNDTDAVSSTSPTTILDVSELIDAPGSARVVIAMRLHAALMAIRSGHYVIHLAYERKGFGAFADLGLSDYVFNVHDFDAEEVAALSQDLRMNAARREAYDRCIGQSMSSMNRTRELVSESILRECRQKIRSTPGYNA